MTPSSLSSSVFHILFALADADLHGLGIAARVEEATDGAVELGPGTLYRALKLMARDGLIREAAAPVGADPRRKYYAITASGRQAVTEEAARMERLVRVAHQRNVLPERA